MGNNPSVKQLRTDFQDFAKNVATDMRTATNLMANEIRDNMAANAPLGDTDTAGDLKASVRTRDVSTETKISVLVMAGGPKTIRRTSQGHAYDYAIATEFGTRKEAPEPFFYPTYRAYKAGGLEFFKETLEQTIEENNAVRALRSQNYSNQDATISAGHRGAVVINKGKP